MDELGLTDLKSLDAEQIVIDGVDVDEALNATKVRGSQIVKRRRMIKFVSIGSALSVFLIAGALVAVNLTGDSNVQETAEQEVLTTVEIQPPTTLSPSPAEQVTPTTQAAPVISPRNVTIRSFGSQSVCNPPSSPDPGAGGVVIGPASALESWNPGIGQTYQVTKTSGETLTLVNKASNNATNGQFVDLQGGFNTSGTYADITTLSFTYCESGLRLAINPTSNGYTVDILRW